jgi:hypothetical protein
MRTPDDHAYLDKTYGSSSTTPTPVPQMDYKDTVAGQMQSMGMDPTFANRSKMAEEYGITGYSGSMEQNMKLLDLIKSGGPNTGVEKPVETTISDTNLLTQTPTAAISTPTPTPERKVVIQDNRKPVTQTSEEDIKILNNIQNMGLRRSGQWLNLTEEDKLAAYKRGSKFEQMPMQSYSFGGVVKMLKYAPGGEVGAAPSGKQDAAVSFMIKKDLAKVKKASTREELSSLRKEMESTYGPESAIFTATNRKLYEFDATDDQKKAVNTQLPLDDKPVVGDIFKYISGKVDKVQDEVINKAGTSTAEILGNTPEKKLGTMSSSGEDLSLPNWGRAKNEQQKLNNLILADRNAGKTNLEMLAEDDIIGDKTREAMAAYSGKGYARPELFSEANLAQYEKNIAAGMKIGGNAEKKETVKNPLNKVPTGFLDDAIGMIKNNQEQTNKTIDEKRNSGNDALLSNIPKVGQKIEPKKVNESNLKSLGFGQLNSKDVQVGDGDGVKINGIDYRIGDIDGVKAWFDAAETRFKGNKAQYKSGKSTYQNTAKQTFEELVKNTDKLYFKDTGKKTGDGRPIGLLYYGDKNNPGLFHSSDSAMVKKGEAIYGMKKGSTEKQTDRQKDISKDAAPFLYHDSPFNARRTGDNLINNSELGKPNIMEGSVGNIFGFNSAYKIPKVESKKTEVLRKANGELYPISDETDSPYKTKNIVQKTNEYIKGITKIDAKKERTIKYENNRDSKAKEVDDINEKQEILRRAAVNQSHKKDSKSSYSLKEGYLDFVGDDTDKYKRKKYLYDEVNSNFQKILSNKKYSHLSIDEKYSMLQRYYSDKLKNSKK